MDFDKTKEFYEFLLGKDKEFKGLTEENKLNLTPEQAFHIIYYLQEKHLIIPDVYEKCNECQKLYNSEKEGHHNTTSWK